MSQVANINNNHEFFKLSNAVQALTKPTLSKFGITSFIFKRTLNDFSKIYLFNNQVTQEYYFSQQYFSIGSKEGPASLYSSSHDLWDYLPNPNGIYSNFNQLHNIANGLTITRKNKDYCDFFAFGTTRENIGIKKYYLNQMGVFDQFCDYFLDSGKAIISSATANKIILPYKPIDTTNILTKRENDCVHYLVQGKTNKEIARCLDLSPRTVEEYIANVRGKLGARNRSELIAALILKPL